MAKADNLRSNALVNVLLFTGIQRKGGKTAKVAVPPPAVEALNLYLGTSGADVVPILGHAQSRPLFTTRTGRAWNRSEAFRTVQQLARKAGVEGQISPHSLRHTFATIAQDNGVALHDLQDSLGQSDPRTTRRYGRSRHKPLKSARYDVARALA